MIYQYVKRYLKNTFIEPNSDTQWATLENIKFFNHLQIRYSNDEIEKEINEIKIAFRDFFEAFGKIIFRYKEDVGIKFKILPYSVKPKDSKHLKNIVHIINHNRKYIEYPYQEQTDQIAILGKIRREINKEVADSNESVNVRELIKYAIKIALNLGENDVVTQLKRVYIVKIFEKNTLLSSSTHKEPLEKREGVANRFNGYTAEQIKSTYKEIFIRGDAKIEYFLKNMMKNIFKEELNFKIITNIYYETKALKIIHSATAKELEDYISLEEDYIFGIAGYLMRINFEEIHTIMAVELIKCIYEKDRNANNFLLYYSGNTILKNNKKYQIPSLESESGEKWNSGTLIGICNLWMNTKKKKEKYENKLVDVEAKLTELEKELLYIKPEIEFHQEKIDSTEKKLLIIEKKHNEIQSKFKYLETTNLNSTEYFSMKKMLQESEENLRILKTEEKEARTNLNAIKDANKTTYTELESFTNLKHILLKDVKAQNLNIDSKSAQMDPILRAIAKVLMSRTKILS